MLEEQIQVINRLGLHARAAAQLVKLASQFKSKIKLERTDNFVMADAKSILSVLTLAAAKGTTLLVKIEGEDENNAWQAIKNIFEQGFGEN